jgi:hypothetical protein
MTMIDLRGELTTMHATLVAAFSRPRSGAQFEVCAAAGRVRDRLAELLAELPALATVAEIEQHLHEAYAAMERRAAASATEDECETYAQRELDNDRNPTSAGLARWLPRHRRAQRSEALALSAAAVSAGTGCGKTKHHCGQAAEHVDLHFQPTRYGVAAWLTFRCKICGRRWDVLGNSSDPGVIEASVFPVFALPSCDLCCRGECLGTPDCCPCHSEPTSEVTR